MSSLSYMFSGSGSGSAPTSPGLSWEKRPATPPPGGGIRASEPTTVERVPASVASIRTDCPDVNMYMHASSV